MRMAIRLLIANLALVASGAPRGDAADFDTEMVRSTFKLTSPQASGTGLVVTRPDPGRPGGVRSILVTANHVFAAEKGEDMTIHFRKEREDGQFAKVPTPVKIRRGGEPLWANPPGADVAALEFTPPADLPAAGIPLDGLATDADLERLEVHPGDLIRCVGFPFPNQFEATPAGFGVVRLGCIASYPLRPTRATRTFLCDLNSFGGDSGSPVYLPDDRKDPRGEPARRVLGLNVGQHNLDEEYHLISESGKRSQRMGIIVVFHATAIREAIDLLPRVP